MDSSAVEEIVYETSGSAKSGIISFLSGGVGGISLVFVGQPLDLVKVKMQTAIHTVGFGSAIRSVFANDGLRGFYRGMGAPLTGITPIIGLYYWGFEYGKTLFSQMRPEGSHQAQVIFAGAFSAFPAAVVMIPGERIKVLLQSEPADPAKRLYKGPIDCATKLLKADGLCKGLYRGAGVTLVREIFSSMVYYATYEILKRKLQSANSNSDSHSDFDSRSAQLPSGAIMLAGGTAGALAVASVLPLDMVKSVYQSQATGAAAHHGGALGIFRHLVATGGYAALFRGFQPILLRAFPANAACFLAIEHTKDFLNRIF